MNSSGARRSSSYGETSLHDVIRLEMKPALKELESVVRILPRVGPVGESDCPFAAQLYVQKEAKARRVAEVWTKLRYRLETVVEEILQCQERLRVVGRMFDDVESDTTRKRLGYAHNEVEGQLRGAESARDELKATLEEIERTLMLSEKLSHPDVPAVGVPAWPPEGHGPGQQWKPRPPSGIGNGLIPRSPAGESSPIPGRKKPAPPLPAPPPLPVPPPVVIPAPLPLPVPAKPAWGLGKDDTLRSPPIWGQSPLVPDKKPAPPLPAPPPAVIPAPLPLPLPAKPTWGLGKLAVLPAPAPYPASGANINLKSPPGTHFL